MKNKTFFLLLIILTSCIDTEDTETGGDASKLYPILLLAGYANSQSVWEEKGFVEVLTKQDNVVYGGKISTNSLEKWQSKYQQENDKRLCVSIAFSDSIASISKLSEELSTCIASVLETTKAKKVIIVGYSMGGLITRNYLTQNVEAHHVEALITVSSPHKGSYLANLFCGSGMILGGKDGKLVKYFKEFTNEPISGAAICQMTQNDDDNFIGELNKKKHPEDIKYHSIIARSTFSVTLRRISIFLKDAFGTEVPQYDGDYVVETSSQNMNNIEAFQSQNIISDTVVVENTHHFNILSKSEIILSTLKRYTDK
jgi:pimeloyl-ACP methyl ester carboxylesterase